MLGAQANLIYHTGDLHKYFRFLLSQVITANPAEFRDPCCLRCGCTANHSSKETNANPLVADLPECNGLKINAGIGFPAFAKLSSGADDSNEDILLCS